MPDSRHTGCPLALVLGLLLVVPMLTMIGCGPPRRPNIVLITLDTTRADRLGCYGYSRDTSPNVDRLAGDSILYTRAYATSSWTLPTHASLFTGKLPSSHGARYDPEGPLILTQGIDGPEEWNRYRARGLSPRERTLARLLGEEGYRTGAVVAGPWMKEVFGFATGFDEYDDENIREVTGRLAHEVSDRAIDWLKDRGEQPFFLFLNYYDPHSPFLPPREYWTAFLDVPPTPETVERPEVQNALYDAEILYMDFHFGRLMDFLKAEGLYEDTIVIVTADHGELLGENGRFGHGKTLTEPEIHIPFLLKKVGQREGGTRRDDPIQQTDVLPLLLELLDLPVPEDVQGRPLSRIHGADPATTPVIAEVYPLPLESPRGDFRVLLEGGFKFTWNSQGRRKLVELARDPEERKNLREAQPEKVRAMEERLEKILAGLPAPLPQGEETTVDEATRKALEKLGYMEGKEGKGEKD